MLGQCACAAGLFVFAAALVACDASESSSGHWIGGHAYDDDAGISDAAISLADAWPTTDPDPDAAPHGGPAFDGGTRDAAAASCIGKLGPKGDRTVSLVSGGVVRTSLLHVPAAYDPAAPAMLVLNFHGYTSNAAEQVVMTRMNGVSDARGFVVAYPDGVANSWNAGDCCGDSWTNSVDDIAFVRALTQLLETEYCVDPRRRFATGFSNGGFLSHRIACEMADTFAAIAPVSGVLGIAPDACKPSRPVPVLEFHGTSDPVVPFVGGTPVSPVNFGGPVNFRSVSETINFWRTKNDCLGAPSVIYAKGDATCTQYAGCKGDSEVTFCAIEGGGHTWPGGVAVPLGKTSTDISASETIASFFAAHPMP